MRHPHTTQVFTPFGSGYVPENHGQSRIPGYEKKASGAKWMVVVGALLFGATTVGAVTTARRSYPSIPKLWYQPAPSMLINLQDVARLEQSLF
jgi:hypothetical protein